MGAARTHLITLTLGAVLGLFCSSVGASLEVRGKVEGAVELECSVPPPDTPAAASLHVVEWVRQGLDIPVLIQFGAYAPRVHPSYEGRVSLVGDTALRVEALQLEDRGAYLCRILLLNNSTDGLLNGTWTLVSVTAPPTFTKTPLPVLETLVGNRLSLTCAANGNPTPTIIWLKDGAAIQDKNIQVQDGTLDLRAVSMKLGGQYTCQASNTEGNITHLTKLRVKGPPVIVIPPKSTALNMSQNALMQCQAVADPPNMTYVWRSGAENVHHIKRLKSRVKIIVDGTLLISDLLPEDSGNYTCMPTNGLMTPPTASARLTVLHPAMALPMPRETYLATGQGGLLRCPVVAQPPLAHVAWTKDGASLDHLASYPGWTLTPDGSVSMATVNDDAAGVYVCTPYNSYGTMGPSGPTTVILQDPPSLAVAPQQRYQQDVGRELLVPCRGNDPDAAVTWSKVGPAPRSGFSVAANGSLLLQPVSKDHQGAWQCSVSNRVASVNASTVVHVLGTTPHAASSLAVVPGVRQANVSWEPGFHGGSAATYSVWVKQVSGGDTGRKPAWFSVPVPPSSGSRLQVTDLAAATDYQFSILAQNSVGTGPFSDIVSVRTLDPLARRSKPKPPVSLSANRGSAGVVLRWVLPPAAAHQQQQPPPVTGFVLQSRTQQGEWLSLDEDISANASEIIVPGLNEDRVYELRLLSRQGELLSEPSPSVNVSTMGMQVYPSTSRLLEFVPEPLLAGVMGGVGFMCLALVLLLGSACIISHKRDQRRKKRNELPPAIYKCPPSIRSSGTSSPDSVLKKNLLHSPNLYPTVSSTASSSTQFDCTYLSQGSPADHRDQCKELLCTSHDFINRRHGRTPHTRPTSSPVSPPLEMITRGPDGRFIDQPYDQATTMKMDNMCTLKKGRQSIGFQRSLSLHSERGGKQEPPFVLSVDLPPCQRLPESNPTNQVRAPTEHLTLHGRCILDEKEDHHGQSDCSSLLCGGSQSSFNFPHPEGDKSPAYPIMKSIVQPSTTASTLVLQMEHDRERGNLSRCLQLAQEREGLERELRKYTLERGSTLEESGGCFGMDSDGSERVETGASEHVCKQMSSIVLHNLPQGSRGSCSVLSSYDENEALPFISPTPPLLVHNSFQRYPSRKAFWDSDDQHPIPSSNIQTPLTSEVAHTHSKNRLTLPHLPPKLHQHERGEAAPGGWDNLPPSKQVKMQRNDSCSEAWRQNNLSHGSLSTLLSTHSNKYAEHFDLAVTAVPEHSIAEMAHETHAEGKCIEMSVDEPVLDVSLMLPTKPITQVTRVSHVQHQPLLAHNDQSEDIGQRSFKCLSPLANEKFERRQDLSSSFTPRPTAPHLWKATQNYDYHQHSQSLDIKKKKQCRFLTPDAWIDSLSQENCSSPFAFQPESLFWGPHSTPMLETTKPFADSPTRVPLSKPQPLEKSPFYSTQPPCVLDPPSLRSSPERFIPNPSVPYQHNPGKERSIFPDDSRWPITYQEALRSVQNIEAMKEATRSSLPTARGKRHKEGPRPPENRDDRPPQAPLSRGLSWPSPQQTSSATPNGDPMRRYVKETDGIERPGGGSEAEIGDHGGGAADSGGSYCSYASSGRGSLETANGRLSLCLSPTLACSPEEMPENAENNNLHQTEPKTRRKASVDENYEWDAVDVGSQPEEHNGDLGGSLPAVDLQKTPGDSSQSPSLQGHGQSSRRSEPETVLF